MNSFKYPQTLAIFLATLLIFSACGKEIYFNVDPLTVAGAKPGDTLIIKGQKLSDNPAENIVKINGIDANVVSATSTELMVVIPANATSGNVTVTVHDNTADIGSLHIMPLTLFCLKYALEDPNHPVQQIIAIDPENGKESVFMTAPNSDDFDRMNSLLYLPATNELLALSEYQNKLLKIDVVTRQTTVFTLTTSHKVRYLALVLDKKGDLYAAKHETKSLNSEEESLVKIDPRTGDQTVIKSFTYGTHEWYNLVYLPASNEIAGLANSGRWLIKMNLTTKEVSKIELISAEFVGFSQMTVANTVIYAHKHDFSVTNNSKRFMVEINPVTGSQTILFTMNDDEVIASNMIYVPQRKEVVAVSHYFNIYKYNIDTKTRTQLPLTGGYETHFHSVASN